MIIIAKFIKKVLRIYKIIMRIKEYVDFKKIVEDYKENNPDGVFGKPKPRSIITRFMMKNVDKLEKTELEKRNNILRKRNRRNNRKE